MDKNTDISLFEMFLFHAQLFGTFLNLHCNPFVKIELGIQEIWRRHSFGGGKYVKIDMLGPAVDVLHSTSVWLILLHDHIYITYILCYVNIIYIIVWYCLRTFAVKMVTPWRIQLFYQSVVEAWTCGMFHSCLPTNTLPKIYPKNNSTFVGLVFKNKNYRFLDTVVGLTTISVKSWTNHDFC